MKKTLLFLSSFILAATACSCSGKGASSSGISLTEPKFTDDGKPIVTVGTLGNLDPLFTDDLNKPSEFKIEIVNYSKDVDKNLKSSEYTDACVHNLDIALISGDFHDILMLSPEIMEKFERQGTMTDLYPFMDGENGYSREDFLPCVLEGLDIDGKLPALMDSYYIHTMVAKTKDIPKEYENWTAADAMSFYEKFCGERDFCDNSDMTSLASHMLRVESRNCVDTKTGSCDFSGAFTELLRFCKDKPVNVVDFSVMSDEAIEEYQRNEWTKGLNDTNLVYDLGIDGFDSMYGQHTYGYFNKADLTFVGYPSENGCGAYVTANSPMFGICEYSGNKDLAWELICRMLEHQPKLEKNQITGTRGIPVLMEQLQRDYDRSDDYEQSINSHLVGMNELNEDGEKMPQEYKDMLYDYLLSVPADPYLLPYSVQNIIDEEIAAAVIEDRTAEQAAEILQNRLETYISEIS